MKLTSIVIPTSNGRPWLMRCVASIRSSTPEPHELIVVDNGTDDGTADYCLGAGVRLIACSKPLGFPAAVNRGLRWAGGEAVLIMNNDVTVAPGWLGNMLRCLESDASVGMVGPLADHASGKQMSSRSFRSEEHYLREAARLNRPDPRKWQETLRLVGLCLLVRRSVLEEVGTFDERFSPGHYEDDDLCHRVRSAGYRLMIAGDVQVRHTGSATFRGLEQAQVIARNHARFIDKWGFDPRELIERPLHQLNSRTKRRTKRRKRKSERSHPR